MKRFYTLMALLGFALASATPLRAQEPAADPKQLVWEAWRAVSEQYYDPSFEGADWPQLAGEFLSRSYESREQAHAAIVDMLERLDNPATRFLTGEQAQNLQAEFDGNLGEGVGLIELLSVDTDETTGNIVVVTPVPDTPAAAAGLKTNDVIVAVDGVSTDSLDLAATMSALRGPPGEPVTVTVSRSGEVRPVRIVRAEAGTVMPLVTRRIEHQGASIGYLGLRLFNQASPGLFLNAVKEMEAEGVDAYILDLRNNPGGFVAAVQQIAGALAGEVPLARVHARTGVQALASEGEQLTEAPLIVLINEGSASAAEVLASALQFHDRGILVGARTFGKGLAHGFAPLSDGSAVLPTIGRLETMAGEDILDRGVEPDVGVVQTAHPVVDMTVDVASAEDVQFQAALDRIPARPGD